MKLIGVFFVYELDRFGFVNTRIGDVNPKINSLS